jgi:YbbR domain-containing protein
VNDEKKGAKLNVPMLIASLIVSFFLWASVYAQNLPVVTRSLDVDLLLQGLDGERYAVVKRPATIKVWYTGSEQQMKELRDMEKYGRIELSQAVAGDRSYPVLLQPPLLRDLAHDSVPEIRLDIQPISTRTFKVSRQTKGKLPGDDLRLDSLVVEPDSITITGARSLVSQVAEARITFDLSLADPKMADPHRLTVDLLDARGVRVPEVVPNPPLVNVTPVLIPSPEEKTASILARFKGRVAPGYEQAGYRLERETVSLVGPSYALAMVSAVETQPIDIEGLSENKEFTVPLRNPPGVTSTKPKKVKVRVLIRRAPPTATPPPAPAATTATTGGEVPTP